MLNNYILIEESSIFDYKKTSIYIDNRGNTCFNIHVKAVEIYSRGKRNHSDIYVSKRRLHYIPEIGYFIEGSNLKGLIAEEIRYKNRITTGVVLRDYTLNNNMFIKNEN